MADINSKFGEFAAGLVVMLALLVTFLATGQAPVARTFTRLVFVRRRDAPGLYWLFILVWSGLTAVSAWRTALAGGLDDLLPPAARATVEQVAPYAAALILATFIISALSTERRRRVRLRGELRSAVERAASGL